MRQFVGIHSDDESGTDQSTKKSKPISKLADRKTVDTLGGDGESPLVIDRGKTSVKIPSHLRKKYPPNIHAVEQRGRTSKRKPPPPVAPPPGPPPLSAFRKSQANDHKLE